MPRIAYRDEYPWHRCSCGWLLYQSGNMATACPNCGTVEASSFRDRCNPTNEYRGHIYIGVKWEDVNRKYAQVN